MNDGNQRLDLSEAISLLQARVIPKKATKTRSLDQALDQISAADVAAPVSLPPFPSSAMDGYAFAHAFYANTPGNARLTVVGTSAAGHPYVGPVQPGECVRILTGAVVPPATDTVVIQEDVQAVGADDTTANTNFSEFRQLDIQELPPLGANVRAIGNDVRAGDLLLAAGQRLNPFALGWLAASGIAEIEVVQQPKVALLSTGDELRPPGSTLAAGEIYDSNRLLLRQLLKRLPVEIVDLGTAPDEHQAIQRRIEQASRTCDAIISTGGVSVGDADHVTNVLNAIGELEFWRLNLKPGKPMAVGKIGDCWFFGLPGNPVSCAVTAMLVARPALLRLAGALPETNLPLIARLAHDVQHRPGREEYLRGRLIVQDGEQCVRADDDQGSNRLGSFANANCLIRIPKSADNLGKGTLVDVINLKDLR